MRTSQRVPTLLVAVLAVVFACALTGPSNAHADEGAPLPPATSGVVPSPPSPGADSPGADAPPQLVGSTTAAAGTVQTASSNTIVVVRIASPGNDGPITQVNEAGATASSDIGAPSGDITAQNPPAGADLPTGGTAADSEPTAPTAGAADAATSQQGASNLVVSIRVQSPGDIGPVTQTNIAGSAASSSTASAAAQQATSTSATPPPDVPVTSTDQQYQVPAEQYQSPPAAVTSASSSVPTSWTWIWVWNCAPATLSGQQPPVPNLPAGASWTWTWNQNCDGIDPATEPQGTENTTGNNDANPQYQSTTGQYPGGATADSDPEGQSPRPASPPSGDVIPIPALLGAVAAAPPASVAVDPSRAAPVSPDPLSEIADPPASHPEAAGAWGVSTDAFALAGLLSLEALLASSVTAVLGVVPSPVSADSPPGVIPVPTGGFLPPQTSDVAGSSSPDPATPAGAADPTVVVAAVSVGLGAGSTAAGATSTHAIHRRTTDDRATHHFAAWWRSKGATSPWSAATPLKKVQARQYSAGHLGAGASAHDPANAPSVPAPLFPDPTRLALIASGSATTNGPSGAAVVGALVACLLMAIPLVFVRARRRAQLTRPRGVSDRLKRPG